jgi:hypothetical protein
MDVFLPPTIVSYSRKAAIPRRESKKSHTKRIREFLKWKALECNGLFSALE